MTYKILIQNATSRRLPFTHAEIQSWVRLAASTFIPGAEISLRFTDRAEMQSCNRKYRDKDKPTNVLAFPARIPHHQHMRYPPLGDLLVCPDVLYDESHAQQKTLKAHWAHIIMHGILHLGGYDHIDPADELIMQAEEIRLLDALGFDNPYTLAQAAEEH